MRLFLYIIVFFAIPCLGLPLGQYAVAQGTPSSIVFLAAGVLTSAFAWHCARLLTVGRPW